jgi:isopentenyl diphosphate isomerase/L-lactate dehydrogenase-like FMN-dependent dehydrogenase
MDYKRISDANEITARYMDSILIKERLIDSVVADTKLSFLNKTFDMPVMMPAFSHLGCFNGRDVKIIVDCGISSGADVFKALALGADAAAVGRSMLPSLENEGTAGVLDFIKDVQKELRFIMSCTGYAKTSDIDDICIKKLL